MTIGAILRERTGAVISARPGDFATSRSFSESTATVPGALEATSQDAVTSVSFAA